MSFSFFFIWGAPATYQKELYSLPTVAASLAFWLILFNLWVGVEVGILPGLDLFSFASRSLLCFNILLVLASTCVACQLSLLWELQVNLTLPLTLTKFAAEFKNHFPLAWWLGLLAWLRINAISTSLPEDGLYKGSLRFIGLLLESEYWLRFPVILMKLAWIFFTHSYNNEN